MRVCRPRTVFATASVSTPVPLTILAPLELWPLHLKLSPPLLSLGLHSLPLLDSGLINSNRLYPSWAMGPLALLIFTSYRLQVLDPGSAAVALVLGLGPYPSGPSPSPGPVETSTTISIHKPPVVPTPLQVLVRSLATGLLLRSYSFHDLQARLPG